MTRTSKSWGVILLLSRPASWSTEAEGPTRGSSWGEQAVASAHMVWFSQPVEEESDFYVYELAMTVPSTPAFKSSEHKGRP